MKGRAIIACPFCSVQRAALTNLLSELIIVSTTSLKDKYEFVNISVLLRTNDGDYLNVTDLNLCEEKEKLTLNSTARLLISFCTFFKKERYASEATVEELLALAHISRKSPIIELLTKGFDEETAFQLVVQLCAKKILEYAYGRATKRVEEDGIYYDFARHRRIEGKAVYPVMLSKKMEKVYG